MIPLGLDEIARVVSARSIGTTRAVNITGVTIDSRSTTTGDLFFALDGTRTNGHDFVADAFERGAYACVVSRPIEPDDSPITAGQPVLLVSNVVTALGRLAAYHRQQVAATTIAVTGSNGKSTVRAMIDHVLSTRLTGRGAIKSYNNELGLPLTLLACNSADATGWPKDESRLPSGWVGTTTNHSDSLRYTAGSYQRPSRTSRSTSVNTSTHWVA